MARSVSRVIQLPCVQCRHPVSLHIWSIVDLAERPDLVDRIRRGEIHIMQCSYCGNDTAEYQEQCDGPDLRSQNCTGLGLGYTGGVLGCLGDCTWDTSGCT